MRESAGTPWPHCPVCQQPRQTRCPVCHAAGHDFIWGDVGPEAAPLYPLPWELNADNQRDSPGGREEIDSELESTSFSARLRLICPTCDEPILVVFYRCCQQCGHDFGYGITVDAADPADGLNQRAVVVLAAILGVGSVLSLYFAWLLR